MQITANCTGSESDLNMDITSSGGFVMVTGTECSQLLPVHNLSLYFDNVLCVLVLNHNQDGKLKHFFLLFFGLVTRTGDIPQQA